MAFVALSCSFSASRSSVGAAVTARGAATGGGAGFGDATGAGVLGTGAASLRAACGAWVLTLGGAAAARARCGVGGATGVAAGCDATGCDAAGCGGAAG